MKKVDQGLQDTNQDLCKIENCQVSMEGIVRSLGSHLDVRVQEIRDFMGSKPLRLEARFDALDLWGTVGNVATYAVDMAENFQMKTTSLKTDIQHQLNQVRNASTEEIHDLKDKVIDPLEQKVTGLKSIVKQVSNALKGGINNNTSRINRLATLMGHHPSGTMTIPSSEINQLEARIESLSLEVVKLKNSHKESIAFHGLGFPSFEESKAWLQIKVPTGQFGYVVDFHTTMEHIFTQITGMDSLKQLEKFIS